LCSRSLSSSQRSLISPVNDTNKNRDTTRTQVYTYDHANRVLTGGTNSSCGSNCWGLTFGIDQWGNLQTAAATGSATPLNLSMNANNHITTAPFAYDAAGNETADAVSTYVWNAEGQLTTGGGVTYTCDGDGKRVEKSNGKLYWYGMSADALDETDATGSTTNSSFNEYIFFGAQRVARQDASGNVFYSFADHLGTSRTIVQAGQTTPCYDADFYPFGGEKQYTNTCTQNYKFTGKERDSESGLDNFGARYDASTVGRFMSPDPDNRGAVDEDPQTWNAYSYVRDNPLKYTDPDGTDVHLCVDIGNSSQTCVNLTDEQYRQLYNQQNGQQGINLPGGLFPNGNVTCNGGQVCGSAQYFEPGLSDDPIIAPTLFGGIAGGIKAGIRGIVEGIFGSGVKTAAEEAAEATVTDAAARAAAEVSNVVAKAAAGVGNQTVKVASKEAAEAAAKEFLGPDAAPITDRLTGAFKGWISSDGTRAVIDAHADEVGEHMNFINKMTGGNLHVRW
jgi:RHS repeat-associated protein